MQKMTRFFSSLSPNCIHRNDYIMINYWYHWKRQSVSYAEATDSTDICGHKEIDRKVFGHTVKMIIPLLPIEKALVEEQSLPPCWILSHTHTNTHIWMHTHLHGSLWLLRGSGAFPKTWRQMYSSLRASFDFFSVRSDVITSHLPVKFTLSLGAGTVPQKTSREKAKQKTQKENSGQETFLWMSLSLLT